MCEMLKRILAKFGFSKEKEDNVILPPAEMSRGVKYYKVALLKMPEDILKLRPKMEEYDLMLIRIDRRVIEGFSSQMKRLKYMAQDFGFKVYGIDPKWIVLTKFEVEKPKKKVEEKKEPKTDEKTEEKSGENQ